MASDPYAKIAETDPDVVRTIADRLEVRASHPDQRAMLETYLDDIGWPEGAAAVEVGCGTGAVSRVIAARSEPASVLGVDPAPLLVDRARRGTKPVVAGTFAMPLEEHRSRQYQ